MNKTKVVPCYAEIAGAVARGWCHPANERKEMDTTLAMAITAEIVKLLAASPAPQERRVGQRRVNYSIRPRLGMDRRATAPNAAVVYQCPRCATSMEVDPTAAPSPNNAWGQPEDIVFIPGKTAEQSLADQPCAAAPEPAPAKESTLPLRDSFAIGFRALAMDGSDGVQIQHVLKTDYDALAKRCAGLTVERDTAQKVLMDARGYLNSTNPGERGMIHDIDAALAAGKENEE